MFLDATVNDIFQILFSNFFASIYKHNKFFYIDFVLCYLVKFTFKISSFLKK